MKIALAQINPTVGDFENNLIKILKNISEAEKQGSDLIYFQSLHYADIHPKIYFLKNNL